MSLNAILSSALTALRVNQSALGTTSTNIANVNTEGYQRRQVIQEPGVVGGAVGGVSISEVRRIAATYFARESIEVTSLAARAEAQAIVHDRVQTLIGSPDGEQSVAAQITALSSALGQAAIDPTSIIRRNGVLSSVGSLAQTFDSLARRLQELRADTDSQIEGLIGKINGLIQRIDELNPEVQRALIAGESASGLLDQRDQAITELAGLIDIRVNEQPDGRLFISTPAGLSLVSDVYVELSYTRPPVVTAGTVFPEIIAQRINPRTDAPVGPPRGFEAFLGGGELAGLLDMRNNSLRNFSESLGALAGATADQLNKAHNDATAVPPVAQLVGRNTGLEDADAMGFTGRTTIAIVGPTGALVRRIDIDFDAGANGTYAVDGGAAVAIGGPAISDFESAIGTALAGTGTIDFSNGVMTLGATGAGNGVAVQQDASSPSARGGRGLAHFFGLNDLVRARGAALFETGLSLGDAHQFTAGQTVEFNLRGPLGDVALNTTLTIGGATIGDIVTGLNTQFAGYGTFALDGAGRLGFTPSGAYGDFRLEVAGDGTARGTSGVSLSRLFGLGPQQIADQAAEMAVRADIAGAPQRLALAAVDLAGPAAPGDIVVGASDNRGALALQGFETASAVFTAAGHLPGMTTSIGEYAATFLVDAGQRAALAEDANTDLAGLKAEVFERRAGIEGVNLDEELAAMILYQQAYNAGARVLSTAQDLYDTLIGLVG